MEPEYSRLSYNNPVTYYLLIKYLLLKWTVQSVLRHMYDFLQGKQLLIH